MSIASTILAQLGGNKFLAMTGAKNLTADGSALMFKLPKRFAKRGIDYVKITLNAMDLYDVELFHLNTLAHHIKTGQPMARLVTKCDGVYAEMLRDVFTTQTGLDTSL